MLTALPILLKLLMPITTLLAVDQIIIPIVIAGGIALVLGVIIMVSSHFFAIPVDEKLEAVKGILPGVNCGACGFSGCEGYATALAEGLQDSAKCPVGGPETARQLSNLLGLAQPDFMPKAAYVACNGTNEHTHKRFEYAGTLTCAAAHGLFSGPNACSYGCIGFGDCEAACPYGAISIVQGVAVVDSSRCTACGFCVATCPKNLISIIPKHLNAYMVRCRNKWPGAQTRKNCQVGCIGCQRCMKTCRYGAITMDGPLAVIDQHLCTHCGECLPVCPTGTISNGLPPNEIKTAGKSKKTENVEKVADG